MKEQQYPRVLAIVLNWQQAEVTLQCVQALRAMIGPPLDILVIDNGSGDESASILKNAAKDFRFLPIKENKGFAAGNNSGLRIAIEEEYEFALMVNNDAFADEEMLIHLMAQTDRDIALLSPKIFYEADPERIWFANGRRHPTLLDLRDTGKDQLDGPEWQVSRNVDYLLGTCLLINLAAVKNVGLMDERFFFYFEDLDWSLRFQEAGYRLRLVADAYLYHRVAFSTGGQEDSPLRRFHLAKSSVIFWRKHADKGRPIMIALFRFLSALKMISRLLLRGRFEAVQGYIHGLREGWQQSQKSNIPRL